MGYTAYYRDWTETEKTLRAFNTEALDLLKAFGVPQADEAFLTALETGDPLYDAYAPGQAVKECCRYGVWESAEEDVLPRLQVYGPHEDFYLTSNQNTFTKTARKSYDILIKCLYALAWTHLGGTIDHDGADVDYLVEELESAHPDDIKTFFDVVRRYRLDQVEIGDSKVRPRMPTMGEIQELTLGKEVA